MPSLSLCPREPASWPAPSGSGGGRASARASVLGSILVDHLVNGAGLFLGVLVLPLLLDLPPWLHSAVAAAFVVFVAALVTVALVRRGGPPAEPARGAGAPLRAGLAEVRANLRLGLAAVGSRRLLARSALASLVAWLLEIQVVLLTLHAFGIAVPWGVCVLVLVAANLALVAPFAPPGNFGTLEVGAMLALMGAGVAKEPALAFALGYHLLQVVPLALGGLVLAGRSLLSASPVPEQAGS